LFLKKLFIIKFKIILFNNWYINCNNFLYFIKFLIIFLKKIKILIVHNNKIILFLKYDLLGLKSYFLVLFYNNWLKINGKFITFITNRLGDFFILKRLIYFIIKNNFYKKIFLFLIGKFTKSKIYPFSKWLPYKIKKPTTKRKFLHRSTLVSKGLYLIIYYFNYFFSFSFYILFIKIFTCIYKNKIKIIEIDKKKIIKFSTLKQLKFIKFTIKLGFKNFKIMHLLKHKFKKKCIFIQVGFFLRFSYGNQDLRLFNNKKIKSIKKSKIFLINCLFLKGFIFSKCKIRKEIILNNKKRKNKNIFLILFIIK
jgi:NADH-ubiquinone oxidoreductase chain 5